MPPDAPGQPLPSYSAINPAAPAVVVPAIANDGLTVSGITTPAAANGFHATAATVDGHPSYERGNYSVIHDESRWKIKAGIASAFISNADAATPWEVAAWTAQPTYAGTAVVAATWLAAPPIYAHPPDMTVAAP